MSKTVTCVPGGHQVDLAKALYCPKCDVYVCYSHAVKSLMYTTVKCPRGHEIHRAR